MAQILYPNFLENEGAYLEAKAYWQQLFHRLAEAYRFTYAAYLNEHRAPDGNPIFNAYSPTLDRAVRIIQVDPAEAVAEPDIKAWIDTAVLSGQEREVPELVIDLVLTDSAAEIGERLLQLWVGQRKEVAEMQIAIEETIGKE